MYHKRILLMMAFAMAAQPVAAPMPAPVNVLLPVKPKPLRVPQTLTRQNAMRQAQVRNQRPERRYA